MKPLLVLGALAAGLNRPWAVAAPGCGDSPAGAVQ